MFAAPRSVVMLLQARLFLASADLAPPQTHQGAELVYSVAAELVTNLPVQSANDPQCFTYRSEPRLATWPNPAAEATAQCASNPFTMAVQGDLA
jgi:hypothetical protein